MANRNHPTPTQKPSRNWLRNLLTFAWLRPDSKPEAPATRTTTSSRKPAAVEPVAVGDAPKTAHGKVYFSPGDDRLNAIIAQIHAAGKSLDICVFTISDDRISEAIIACHRSRIPVRIITDNEKLFDQGSDIERFAKVGIPILIDRTEAHMHHKFALIDGKAVVTGSYNWTRSAAIYNMENVLVTAEPGVIAAYAREFQRLWLALDAY